MNLDISVILKKATGPQPEKRAPPQKSHGIATNFNAIREYLRKFIVFIKSKVLYIKSSRKIYKK